LDAGEVEKLVKLFPKELQALWPAARHAGAGQSPAWQQ
jgi:hypothetical protein